MTVKKVAALTITALLAGSLSFGTAFAFSDVEEGQQEAISALQQRGVVSGIDQDHFAPKGKVSFAQGIQMIVKGLDLNLDSLRFFKQPLASDIYANISNDAWYADAFVIAHYNGLDIPADVNPNETITRERFGHLLVTALETKGDFPLIKMYIQIKDEQQITPEYQGSLQRLLLYKITELDQSGNLNPKGEMTRGEAAVWVYKASRFAAEHAQPSAPVSEEIKVTVEKVNDDVNKVTLSRGEKPNAGYGIDITGIRFGEDGQAVITYRLRDPQPDMMYAQVITEAKAVTYISSSYQPVAEPAGQN